MRKSKKESKVYKRIKNKLILSDAALQKRVERLANRLGLETKIAIFVMAAKERIGYQDELKKLPIELQASVQNAVREEHKYLIAEEPFKNNRISPASVNKKLRKKVSDNFTAIYRVNRVVNWLENHQGLLALIGIIITILALI
ncbi:hypothetical protein A2Z22_00925 [Candidatus Woesebacteria bacterium RBG_16_34_12]|uniref:Uncharacterized protein n=1 Tax=Candidatus Woesebacteria bacterium RBG_16_34_12 TaxID=1802480 RepID=A0A1F7XAM6_9BACT|nr:MAG: hypothetical protein A2Z22_00925 [Candidatus Woesebacteria bacterium RBG_16_34_12]